ncbi:hypothetical protein LTS12_027371 [Elasticomyces elasticus]|nr:hypothetical protein LTS12_027371 [Elasticomyces elasticus]
MAVAPGTNVGDASSGSGNVVQEGSAPPPSARSEAEQLQNINAMLASRSDHPEPLRAISVERSNEDPGTTTTHINILGRSSSLSIHRNGSYASAAFTKDPIVDKRDQLLTSDDYFTFDGVDGVKITAHQFNGTFADPVYSQDVFNHAQNFVESATKNFNSSDAWTYQVCNTTSSSPLFNGRIIAEQTAPVQRLGYEDVTVFNCSIEGFDVRQS